MLPPIPTWDHLHPLIVHFPIGLLITAPVLIVFGLAVRRPSVWFWTSALVLMVLGTASAFLAVSTGEAAEELVEHSAQVGAVLDQHEDLAEATAWVFAGLTVLFAAAAFLPRAIRRPMARTPETVVISAFLLMYGAGLVLLINAAHQGGRLVHEFGVRAGSPGASEGPPSSLYEGSWRDDEED